MTSPARRHFMTVSAALAAGAGGEEMHGEAYEQYLAMLHRDKAELHGIRSIQEKVARKVELLPKYEPYIDGVLQSGQGASDQVLVTVLLWKLDTGDIAGATSIAEYAIAHDLPAPDAHQRNNAEILVEESVEQLVENGDGRVDPSSRVLLEEIERIVESQDIVDPVRAKLHKTLGRACEESGDGPAAIQHYAKALGLDARCGCKRRHDDLVRALEKNEQSND